MTPETLATHYGPTFYQTANAASLRSGQVIVPQILDLLHPATVVDVGCGQGEWLSVAAASGVEVQGVDGPHVADDQLLIPNERFLRHDISKPLPLNRRYDVAVSVEVGEHLPNNVAPAFVAGLCRLAPAVVFSAALPGQGGIHHVNEQWPWFWKNLFAQHGYVRLDPFRKELWGHSEVAFYYQQNLYLFVDPAVHQSLIDRIGVPERLAELTLIRTTILQDLTQPRLIQRVGRKLARLLGRGGGP